jgi:type IV secretory pathway VirJ component
MNRIPAVWAALVVASTVLTIARAGSDRIVILGSGDGGWAELVSKVSAALARDGIGVVGLNSLKYFWSARSPEQTTRDIERIADQYVRARVAGLSLIAPSSVANFEVHVTGWLGVAHPGSPTQSEIEGLRGLPMVCIYGKDDVDAIARQVLPWSSGIRSF